MANRDPKVLAVIAAIIQQVTNSRRAAWAENKANEFDYEPMSNKEALEYADELYQAAHDFVEGVLK